MKSKDKADQVGLRESPNSESRDHRLRRWSFLRVRETHRPAAGRLDVIEFEHLPFQPQRMYWLSETDSESLRGCHAHKELHQILFVTTGLVEVALRAGGLSETLHLSASDQPLHVCPGVWREVNLGRDSVLVVLASAPFDPADYIHDLDDFIRWEGSR